MGLKIPFGEMMESCWRWALLYPKIFPPIFGNTFQVRSSNCSRKSKSWPDSLPQIRVSFCMKMLESKGSQMLTIVLICSQDHPCQVSGLAEEVFSINYSNAWKSTMLGQKSTVGHILSKFKKFGQNQHFEIKSIIWSRFDHYSSRNSSNSSKPKSC